MLEGDVYVQTVDMKGSPMPKVIAEGVVKAKTDNLWKVIADCANYKGTLDNVMTSKVLGIFKGKKRCEMVIDLPWPVSNLRSVVDVTLIERPDGSRVRSWKLVEGDYHKNEGGWLLTPRADGFTSVRYHVHVETKVSLPDFVQRMAQKRKIPGLFDNLRDALKKRGQLLP
jgi:ribosome-associated toxin RatA of RatAB toxin-antitoxin module